MAIDDFLEEIRPRVRRVARHVLNGSRPFDIDAAAEDVTQEVLLKAWKLFAQHRIIPDDWMVSKWAEHRAIDFLRQVERRKKIEAVSLDWLEELEHQPGEDGEGTAHSGLRRKWRKWLMEEGQGEEADPRIALIAEAAKSLSPLLRGALVRHYFRGESCKDIALALGVRVGTVRERLNAARKEIRKKLLSPPDLLAA